MAGEKVIWLAFIRRTVLLLAGACSLAPLALMASDDIPAALRRGLVLYFDFDRQERGNVVTDLSGNGNHGSVVGATWTAAGRKGGAYEFTAKGSYISVPNSDSLNPKEITLAAWIKTPRIDYWFRRIFDKNWEHGFQLAIGGYFGLNHIFAQGRAQFLLSRRAIKTDLVVADGQWRHLVAVFDGKERRLYVDGKLQKSDGLDGAVEGNTNNLLIGGQGGSAFDGEIDEPMVYERALSQAEVKLLYEWAGGGSPEQAKPGASSVYLTAVTTIRAGSPGQLEPEEEFLTTDPEVFCGFLYSGARKGDQIRIDWRNPLRAIADKVVFGIGPGAHVEDSQSNGWGLGRLQIAGGPGGQSPGRWEAHVSLNGREVSTIPFRIITPPPSALRILSTTGLPLAVIGAPYYFQLNALGKPPYHWSLVKPLPSGLVLSPDGLITGAPREPTGSFRAILNIQDADGNSLNRTFGIGVGHRNPNLGRVRSLTTAGRQEACSKTVVRNGFSRSDAGISLAALLDGPRGSRFTVEWMNPHGEVIQAHRLSPVGKPECMVDVLPVAGQRAATEPGDWRVRLLYFRNDEVASANFRIGSDLSAAPQPQATERTIRVTEAYVARTGGAGIVQNETEFLTTDPSVWCLFRYWGAQKGDKARIEWRNPLGAIQQVPIELWKFPDWWQGREMRIAGGPGGLAPGEWEARIFVNDRGVSILPFRISVPHESILSILTPTALPLAIRQAPYHLELAVQGGTPPYRWTALRPISNGLTLSPGGLISGTAQESGSFRATLKCEDSAGNSVTRTFGIEVGSVVTEVHVMPSLLKSANPEACSKPTVEADYSSSDPGAFLGMLLDAPHGDLGTVEWLNPRGEVAQADNVVKFQDGPECVRTMLAFSAVPRTRENGDWIVRLVWHHNEVFRLGFHITSGAEALSSARTRRIAFLIGNSKYRTISPPLVGPGQQDLDLLEQALRSDGFQVIRKADATVTELRQLETQAAATVHSGDTVLIYYSGYEDSGRDYWLIPVNYSPGDPRAKQSKLYSLARFLEQLEELKVKSAFVILDAKPYPASSRAGAVTGLSPEMESSTTIVYARPPGGAARPYDPSRSGAFARALSEVLRMRGLSAKTALEVELPKALARTDPSSPPPDTQLRGGVDFVFRIDE